MNYLLSTKNDIPGILLATVTVNTHLEKMWENLLIFQIYIFILLIEFQHFGLHLQRNKKQKILPE